MAMTPETFESWSRWLWEAIEDYKHGRRGNDFAERDAIKSRIAYAKQFLEVDGQQEAFRQSYVKLVQKTISEINYDYTKKVLDTLKKV